jgi:hypothetical protein
MDFWLREKTNPSKLEEKDPLLEKVLGGSELNSLLSGEVVSRAWKTMRWKWVPEVSNNFQK